MRYSVIVPHCNDLVRLERLLNSMPLNRDDVEVIVIDDASENQYEVKRLSERWPEVVWIYREENKGAGAARNFGLENASGEFLIFSDADDEFLPDAFTVFDGGVSQCDDLVYFLATAVQEVDGALSNRADRVNDLCRRYLASPSPDSLEDLKSGHVVPWAKVYRHDFVKKIGARFQEVPVSNDIYFNVIAAFQAGAVKVVPTPVYSVSRRAGSLTVDESLESVKQRIRVLADVNVTLEALGVSRRMNARGYLYRAFHKGPLNFLSVLRQVYCTGLLMESIKPMALADIMRSVKRVRQEGREKEKVL